MQRTILMTLALGAASAAMAQSLPSTGVSAVTTYESAGLYWSSPGASSAGCNVQFRKVGDSAWTQGLNLWFDSAANECRGSLVGLVPGTNYEAQLGVGGSWTRGALFTTWSNVRPVAQTISVGATSSTYTISQGGSASGYVVYDGGGATLNANNAAQFNIAVNASYVIVRNFVLKGAQQDAIRISKDVHDVIIEDNDISGWGRTRDGTWGADMDSGVRAICVNEELTRVTVQRNKIHDPRYPTNSWATAHPAGPQGITFSYCGGNHVFRWNDLNGGTNHFNDAMGGEDNFSTAGFPNKDSDVYGNLVQNTWDDGLEIEGGNKNVRVWGNFINNTGTGVASTITSVGPLYVFRNVWSRNQFIAGASCDSDQKQPMFKSGSSSDFANGRRYLFHNTMLQPTQSGCSYGLGGGAGVGGTGDTQLVHNTVSMNNIYHLWKPNGAVYQVGTDNTFQNDMFNGSMGTAVTSGINATPAYASGSGWQSESGGMYQLAAGTPGYDGGVRIPNFNDGYLGNGPDVGAAEAGAPAMKFGPAASNTSGGTATPPPTSPTPPPTTPTPPPPTTSPGSAAPSLGMDSSAYTIAAGQSVTFTVRVTGNSGTPTGTVNFQSDGASISGCGAIALSSGVANCTTSSLSGGAHGITGVYSGDATYSVGQAGPITETVTGGTTAPATLPTSFGMDSSSYTSRVGQAVTFTASIPGAGGTVNFTSDGVTISGCGAKAVSSSGIATCTTSTLVKGTHAIRGSYSGNGGYAAGVAGPITQTVQRAAAKSTVNVQGLWWGGASQSGWGVNLTQQGDIVFATWFTYDASGKGQWLVMSDGEAISETAFSGTLYRTTGPAYTAATFDPSKVTLTPVGTATLSFNDASNGTFSAIVDGKTVNKAITRQVYSDTVPTCTAGGSLGTNPNYQDLWWYPNGVESGWGMNIAHQGDILFVTLFEYDADGSGLWLVGSRVEKTGAGIYSGTLYRTTGPAFDTASWNPAQVTNTAVGTVTVAFSDGSNGTLTYTANGITRSKPITRQVFSTPATVCR